MVSENTAKLLGMPSQGGFFWRITRRRVVKDWLLLARWSQATGDRHLPGDERRAVRDLKEGEIRKIEASASVGDQAPPGYEWVNPDELANAAEEAGIEVEDPDLLARSIQFCRNNNVTPEEMALMYELGFLDGEPEALPPPSRPTPTRITPGSCLARLRPGLSDAHACSHLRAHPPDRRRRQPPRACKRTRTDLDIAKNKGREATPDPPPSRQFSAFVGDT